MIKTLLKGLAIGLSLAFAFSLVGCGSSSGGGGTTADGGTVTRVANTFDEQCALCHGDGRVADVTVVHDIASNSPVVSIIAVREVNVGAVDDRLEVDLKIVDSDNPFIPIFIDPADSSQVRNLRFTLAKLVPPVAMSGDSSYWLSYINQTETNAGVGTTPVGTETVQATYERANAGVFSALATPGQYRYQFSFNINTVVDPVSGLDILYDKTLTHRIATQFPANVNNGFVDFVPNNLPLASPFPAVGVNRMIVVNANCNECHVKLGLHGGDRINVNFCVTCHNPGTTDANSGNVVDFKVMIHKIHHGAELASGEYTIWGFGDSQHEYGGEEGVHFPQDIRNCTKCHRGGSQSDNWKNVPTREACGSCHDDVNFDTGANHPGLARPDNTQCSDCHKPSGFIGAVEDEHVIPEQVAAAKFKYNIISVTDTPPAAPGEFRVAPGEYPVITFSVTDPTNGNAPYDILTHPAFVPDGGVRRLAIDIGWFTTDYTNRGSTVSPGLPISINPIAGAVDNLDGTFTVVSTVAIPAGITGSAVVAIEGHPAAESVPGSGTYDLRVPVTGAVQAVAVSDDPAAVPQSRRDVVEAANCNNCHGLLSLHGNNRNNNTQLCVLCHNANATDINRRPADPATTTDGKREEAIDFKYMIHSIHAGAAAEHGFRTEGIVVYGFGGTEHDFSHVRLPSEDLNLRNCQGCHKSGGTNELPIDPNALPTTVNTGTSRADPDDDVNITPTASVCSSCHDGIAPKTHMADNGGVFDFRAFTTTTSGGGGGGDQAALCGPGPASAQPAGHSTRTDCCSCHSPN